ncbi:MAG: hypothetical protein V2G43_06855, partial [bacterium JZ-2024 1]
FFPEQKIFPFSPPATKGGNSQNRQKNSASKKWKFQKPTQKILSPYLYRQKVEIPKLGQKNSSSKRWKFQKNGTKKFSPFLLTLKMVEYRPKRNREGERKP